MSCGKKHLVKHWDKPRNIKIVKPSRYEQNEASVKEHWHKVTRDLELSYKDDQFWESQCDTVRELLGPMIFRRVAKIFNLPLEATVYQPASEASSIVPSEKFYQTVKVSIAENQSQANARSAYSMSHMGGEEEQSDIEEEEFLDEDSGSWSDVTTVSVTTRKSSRIRSSQSKLTMSKIMTKSFSKQFSRSLLRQSSKARSLKSEPGKAESIAFTNDDLDVQHSKSSRHRHGRLSRSMNPHFDMLYCSASETDMIKWKSKYKQKMFEVSASDEMSNKAEIIAKKISQDFYDWWSSLGSAESKSEIKRPEDIESLFQVWFDEHSSRGLMLNTKILPCVLPSIANYARAPESSCPRVLKRQIAWDIEAETTPAHTTAFGSSLPHKLKHIPPNNNTKEIWDCVKIPEDLRTMACVWEDISHLTSTKEFQRWLEDRPLLPMPQCFKSPEVTSDKKMPFLVPSDFVLKDNGAKDSYTQELALPVSQFSLELKEVLSKLMNK